MEKIYTSKKWCDDKTIIDDINLVSKQIDSMREGNYFKKETNYNLNLLDENIIEILKTWTGNTYLGQPKDKKLNKAFSNFYSALLNLLLEMEKEKWNPEIRKMLYQGTVYRVLGSGYSKDKYKQIVPQYNSYYVSWSKNKDIPTAYMQSKLYGPLTKIEAEITGDYYGIDLTAFGVSMNDENEVVFPTIKETILDINYIDDEYDTGSSQK